jgi:putative membrane protein
VAGFLLRTLVSAFAIWVAAAIVPGLDVAGGGTLLLAGLLLGLVNATVRPLVILLTFPLTLLSLGLFLWVVNAGMLALVAAMLEGMRLSGFLPALLGSLIVSLVSTAASWWVGPRGRVEVLIVERRGRD